MRPGMRATVMAVALTVLAAGPMAGAAPNEDNQPADAPARYDAGAWRGWMTSAATDRVHDFAQIGDTVYVAGQFTGIRPTRTGPITAQGYLAAFDATTGEPRLDFRPVLDGTVFSLEPSPDGTVLYAAGNFRRLNGANRSRLAALDPRTGAAVPGYLPAVGGGAVRDIVLRGNVLYFGGNFSSVAGQARGRLAAFDLATRTLSATWTPVADGGTVLTLEMSPDGGRLYVGGRFTSINGSTASPWVAALHPATGERQISFAARPGREVFDLLADDAGLVWAALGGYLGRAEVYRQDGSLLTRHETEGDVQSVEQVGRLVYYGGHDIGLTGWEHVGVVDPVAPAILETDPFDEPSTGGDGIWAFHSTGTDLWIGGNVGGPWYGFTRHPATAEVAARTELVAVLSRWRFRDNGAAPAGWTATGFDDSAWVEGPAELGFGDGGEATGLRSGRVTYYFRQAFEVADPAALSDVVLQLLADDGAVAHLNGTEIARFNLPDGAVTDTTRALTALSGNAEDTFRSFAVPPGLLVAGTNTLAVEVHQNGASSSDLSFDARLSAVAGTPVVDTTPPAAPTDLAVTGRTAQSVDLAWTAATDDVGVVGYEVLVDDVTVGSTAGTSFTVDDLSPSTTYTLAVRALDGAENRSGLSEPVVATTQAASGDLVPLGATWRYLDNGTAPADWADPGFDDGTWSQGPAVLGRQEGDEATVLAPSRTTNWFRHRFSVASAAAVGGLRIDLVADDGAVVYLNGVEVLRDNLPAGVLTATTDALSYRTGSGERAVRSFVVPVDALVDGPNVLAVALHQAPGSSDASFDLRLVG